MAVPVTHARRGARRAGSARNRSAAGGDLSPARVRFSRVRAVVAAASSARRRGSGEPDDRLRPDGEDAPRRHVSRAPVAGAVGERQRDVPGSAVLPGVPAARDPAAADVSVHPHLAGGLLDGRRGVFAGDSPPGRRAVRPQPYLCHRHERGRPAEGAERDLSDRCDAEEHRELLRVGWHGHVVRLLHRGLRPCRLSPVVAGERGLRAAQPRDRRRLQRVQRHPVPQRDDLLHASAAGARPRLVRAKLRHVRAAGDRFARVAACAGGRA